MTPADAVRRLEGLNLPGLTLIRFGRQPDDVCTCGDVSADTRFPLASVTKTFTSSLVLEVLQDAGLGLDVRVRDLLPDFRLADPEAARSMTVRDALCHSSGLPPHTRAWVYGDLDRGDWIRERLPYLESTGPFRECHRYSNILYGVMGEVVKALSTRTWEEALSERILVPLGLSSIKPLDQNWAATAPPPHRRTSGGLEVLPPFIARKDHPMAPAGELLGSMADLAEWGRAVLARDRETPLWRVHHVLNGKRPHPAMGPLSYGLGWRLDTVKGETRIWHSGQCSGYSTLLSLYPDRGEGMAVATNLSGAVDVLQALELAVFHNLNPDWATVPEPARAVEKTSPAPPDALPEGHYRNAGYGDLILSVEGGRLWTRFQNAAPAELRISPSGKPLLYLSEYRSGFPIDFRVSETTLRIPFEPQVTPIVFHRVDA